MCRRLINRQDSFGRVLSRLSLPVLFLAIFTRLACAQITNVTNDQSTPIPGAGHDYIHMLTETVNPANGSVSLRIQAPMPKGRGLTLPFAFAYDSSGVHHPESFANGQIQWLSNTSFLSQGGWAYSVPMISQVGERRSYTDPHSVVHTCTDYSDYVFQDSSGGRHALGLAVVLLPYSQDCEQYFGYLYSVFSGGDDYFHANMDADGSPVMIADADGTVYHFSDPGAEQGPLNTFQALPDFVEDRNGNQITFNDQGHGAFTATDTAGRAVISSSGFGSSGNTITISGLSPYTVTWGTASYNYGVGPLIISGTGCWLVPDQSGNQQVITAITLPNGQQYQFQYEGIYGLLSKIIYPTGGYVRYVWGMSSQAEMGAFTDTYGNAGGCLERFGDPAVVQRFVSFDGITEVQEQDFSYSTTWNGSTGWGAKSTTVITHDLTRPGQPSFTTTYTYSPVTIAVPPNEVNYTAIQIPIEQTVSTYDWTGALLRTVNKTWYDQYELKSDQITLDNGLTSETDYSYGPGAQITEKDEYDYGADARGPLLRKTVTSYASFLNTPIYPSGPSIFDQPSTVVTYDGSGDRVAETDYAYDGIGVNGTSGVTGHDYTNYGSSYNNRGNATAKTQWLGTGGSSPVTTYTYDDTGRMLSMTGPCGNARCSDMPGGSNHTIYYSYGDNYASGSPPGSTNAYLTQITYPNTGTAHVKKFSYSYADGQLASSTDQNNQATIYKYNDSLGRLTETDYPDGGQTQITYDDSPGSISVTTTKKITSSQNYVSKSSMDGVGHVTRTELISDPAGIDYTDAVYDGEGRVWTQSNPYRNTNDATYGVTTYVYDALGRATLTVPPDGTTKTNNLQMAYSGNSTTVTDQTGRQRRSFTDGLGRVIEVDEPGPAQGGSSEVESYFSGGASQFSEDISEGQNWMNNQQNGAVTGWKGNALPTVTNPQFQESGLVSTADLSTFAQTPTENIVIDPPPGIEPDVSTGPDGFEINYSPQPLPSGRTLLNVFQNNTAQPVNGRCFSLLQPLANYRVDVFSRTDQFYYMGSSSLTDAGGGVATWSLPEVYPGAILAVLYPTSVPQPQPGKFFATLPAGWIVTSNSGVGEKLSNYKAQIYVKTDIEYLQEDNIPIIVQDAHHARIGSSVIPVVGSGQMTVHILYNDPNKGWVTIYDSLQTEAAYQGLVRSFDVPPDDPLYQQDANLFGSAALQNRSFIYDDALAMLSYSAAGNYGAAAAVVKQLNTLLDNPGYLASQILENAEDGSTARWTPVNGTVTNLNDPTEPPYGTGKVIDFHTTSAGATFTYSGAGFPNTTDTMIQFEHAEQAGTTLQFDITVTTNNGNVTDVQVNSNASGPATYNAAAKQIVVPIGPGTRDATKGGGYRTNLVQVGSLISSLVSGETLTSINSLKATVNTAGADLYFDNLSLGNLQPANSLSFSYDIYNGQIDQPYIRGGSMAWVVYAYAAYMEKSLDYTPALYLQRMINFLETLKSPASDLTNSLYYLGWGRYQNPGYQFVPGLVLTVSTEEQIDLYFAFKQAAQVLPIAATQLLQHGLITSGQATSLNTTASTISAEADTIWNNVSTRFYTAPSAPNWAASQAYALGDQVTDANGNFEKCVVAGTSGATTPAWSTTLSSMTTDGTVTWELTSLAGMPGHFAQGTAGTNIDTSQALDASGTWSVLLAHAAGDDTKATEALKFVYQNFYLSNQQIQLSSASSSYNETYQQSTLFSGFKPYNDSVGGYSGSPTSVWQEGTWGMILALLRLHNVASVANYFAGAVPGGIDAFLRSLINDQATVLSTTGQQGSLLGYSLAARDLPWEFEVWPMFAPTAWFSITSTDPDLLLNAGGTQAFAGGSVTLYTYDALDNLTCVEQHGGVSGTGCSSPPGDDSTSPWRVRRFAYDSLSRLTNASNPESGAANYTYDANGNLLTRTNARGIVTTYSYDVLNRLAGKTYSNGGPAVSYSYDQSACLGQLACYNDGRRTGMSDAAGSEAWSYDPMGGVLADQRTTNGVTKSTACTYNLDGTMASLTNPSGRTIMYAPGGAELPLSAVDQASGINYALNAAYAPQGALTNLLLGQSGGFAGITFSHAYNSRLQPVTIQASSANGTVLSLAYNLNFETANNGNVLSITNNRDSNRSQTFSYDALNRITMASTQATTGAEAWGQSFGYDAWGNLLSAMVMQGDPPALKVTVNNQNQITGDSYDADGDLLSDSVNTYTYDAEGRLKTAGGVTYTYDGDGKRVEKSNGKLYWYGMNPAPLVETDSLGNNPVEYVFFNGQRIARRDASGSVDYYFSDQLGSARVVTDSSGNILDDFDFLPFGGEVPITGPASGNTYKFTGKERDSETGLDYFGARYYASNMGRWWSPDPAFESEILELPQTWNRYSYIYNRPLFATDPDGRCPPCVGAVIGGVVEGGWNLGSQLFQNGGQFGDVNWREVGANALGGAVAGALAGATGGGSLLAEAAVGSGSNAAGGIVTRVAEGRDAAKAFDTEDIISDAVSGFVGGGAGHLASEFVHPPEGELGPRPKGRRHAAKYDAEVNRRKNAALRALGVSTAAASPPTHAMQWGWDSLAHWFEELFFSQASQQQPPQEYVTHRICYTDNIGKTICR